MKAYENGFALNKVITGVVVIIAIISAGWWYNQNPGPVTSELSDKKVSNQQEILKAEEVKQLTKAKEAEQLARAREAARLAKIKEAERLAKAKEAARLAEVKEAEQLAKAKEAARRAKIKKAEQLAKDKEAERLVQAEEAKRAAKEEAAERLVKEQEAKRLADIREAEQRARKQEADRIIRLMGKMIAIPAGSYQMGSDSEGEREKPAHQVSIKGFRLGQFEVTQKQWRILMGNNPSQFKNCDDCPVERVSWEDVQSFLKKLKQKTGKQYRLPTEAEWEYACRSGGKDEEFCGEGRISSLAWHEDNSDEQTMRVGQKKINGLGLYDMNGNVWEWTQDCWNKSYDGAPSDGSAWLSGNCDRRVMRGGSWVNVEDYVRSRYRDWNISTLRTYYIGFRLAQDM